MEPDSLSFLTLINKVQSHSVRGLRGLCFQDTPLKHLGYMKYRYVTESLLSALSTSSEAHTANKEI